MTIITFQQIKLSVLLMAVLLFTGISHLSAQTFCTDTGTEQVAGTQDGYRYELWNQNGQGTACITIDDGALFSGEWSDVLNYLARRGLAYDKTEEHEDIGTIYSTYDCNYNPSSASGNSYLSIYGWTVDPLVEFYIVEDWRNWIPSMSDGATLKGEVEVNDGTYEIVQNTRVDKPSIIGNATFEQYFSIRKNTRNSGTIDISEHFKAWEELGMDMGKMYEVSFVVEGYQSSGTFDFTELDIFVNDGPLSTSDKPVSNSVRILKGTTEGSVSVELLTATTNTNIKVYDVTGKLSFAKENVDTNLVQINNLDSGIYIINITGGNLNYKSSFFVE